MTAPRATPRPMHPVDAAAFGFAVTALAIAATVLIARMLLG